jgi:hypothetical protein
MTEKDKKNKEETLEAVSVYTTPDSNMESLKNKLKGYKINETQSASRLLPFQEFALRVIKDFNITGEYRGMIFRHAKRNMAYLQGKVENCKEKFGSKLNDKGNYLIALFRKTPPWE